MKVFILCSRVIQRFLDKIDSFLIVNGYKTIKFDDPRWYTPEGVDEQAFRDKQDSERFQSETDYPVKIHKFVEPKSGRCWNFPIRKTNYLSKELKAKIINEISEKLLVVGPKDINAAFDKELSMQFDKIIPKIPSSDDIWEIVYSIYKKIPPERDEASSSS